MFIDFIDRIVLFHATSQICSILNDFSCNYIIGAAVLEEMPFGITINDEYL